MHLQPPLHEALYMHTVSCVLLDWFFCRRTAGGWLSRSFSGIAIGTVVAVPMGSYLGGLYGWRCAFASLLPMAFASPSPRCTFEPICQIASIPSVIRKSHSLTMTP